MEPVVPALTLGRWACPAFVDGRLFGERTRLMQRLSRPPPMIGAKVAFFSIGFRLRPEAAAREQFAFQRTTAGPPRRNFRRFGLTPPSRGGGPTSACPWGSSPRHAWRRRRRRRS